LILVAGGKNKPSKEPVGSFFVKLLNASSRVRKKRHGEFSFTMALQRRGNCKKSFNRLKIIWAIG